MSAAFSPAAGLCALGGAEMSGGRAVSRRLGLRKIFNASRSGKHVPMAYETERGGLSLARPARSYHRHSTQTNEPARCAVLLPLLARLPQPLALLEVRSVGSTVSAARFLCLRLRS